MVLPSIAPPPPAAESAEPTHVVVGTRLKKEIKNEVQRLRLAWQVAASDHTKFEIEQKIVGLLSIFKEEGQA